MALGQPKQQVQQSAEALPTFNPADFVPIIDNPYFTLQPGTTFISHLTKCRQRHHGPAFGSNFELFQILDLVAVLYIRLCDHLPSTPKSIEVVHVQRPQIDL